VRIHSAQLWHVGPFGDGIEIEALDHGINILSAVNEAGKSTLIKAVARCLFDRHTCKDSEIKTLQPVGTDLSPRIAVVFETGEGRFKIQKTFLNAPKSELAAWTDEKWKTIADGDQADLRVQRLLQSKQPGRGATTSAHWGMMNYLWARQGEEVSWPEWNSEAGEMIQTRLAKVTLDPVVDSLKDRLWEDYSTSFTGKGQIKKGGPLQEAQAEIKELECALVQVRDSLKQIEDRSVRFQAISTELNLLESEMVEKKEKAVEMKSAAQKVEITRVELLALRKDLESAQESLKNTTADGQALTLIRKEVEDGRDRLGKGESAVVVKEKEGGISREQLSQSEKNLASLKLQCRDLRIDLDRHRHLIEWTRLSAEIVNLEALIGKAVSKQSELLEGRRRLEMMPPIKSSQLKQVETIERSIQDRQIQIEALGLEVAVLSRSPTELKIQSGEKEETISLEPGSEKRLIAAQSMELDLKDWGKVSIRSGSAEVGSLVSLLQEEEGELSQLLKQFGVESVETAREIVRARKELKGEIKVVTASLETLLEGNESLEGFELSLVRKRERLVFLKSELELVEEEPLLTLTELDSQEESFKEKLSHSEGATDKCEAEVEECRQAVHSSVQGISKAVNEVSQLRAHLQHLDLRASQLTERYVDGLEVEKRRTQQRFVEAEARFKAKEKELPSDHEKLAERNRRAAAAAVEVDGRLSDLRRQMDQLKGSLSTLGAQGLYSQETSILEKIQLAQERESHAKKSGWASRLAHDLIEYRKSEATRAVLKPLEDRLSGVFAEVTGDEHRRVFLGDRLDILGVGRSADELVPFRLLSQGAKEQLLLCLRLAVATELAESEPHVLILDDVLVNTDRSRQERILDLLAGIEDKVQIMILTCHPEWYRGVGKTIHL
jgi:hypothetical protein